MAKRLKLKRSFGYENEEKIKSLVSSCKTYTECVIKLGLSPRCSGNFQTIKKYIKKYNIDISHFQNGFSIMNIPKNKQKLEDILVKDSLFSRHSLKERLYKENLKKKECEICGMGEEWFSDNKIVHILDHINGDPYDNRIDNLRIVCPNCNSTLETSTGKNKNKIKRIYDSKKDKYVSNKKYKKCLCGNIILIDSQFCTKCNGEQQRKVQRPSYEILLEELKESNYTLVGRKYGVSDNCIRKWIKNYEKTC